MATRELRSARGRVALVVVALAITGAGCSVGGPDYRGAAEKLIEGDLAEQSGLGTLEATCDQPPANAEVGDVFACTATSESGDVVEFRAKVEPDERIDVESLNLITPDGLATIEQLAADLLSKEVGQTLPPENFDCGDGPVVMSVGDDLSCLLTDPANGDEYESTVTVRSFDLNANDAIRVVVAERPRG